MTKIDEVRGDAVVNYYLFDIILKEKNKIKLDYRVWWDE